MSAPILIEARELEIGDRFRRIGMRPAAMMTAAHVDRFGDYRSIMLDDGDSLTLHGGEILIAERPRDMTIAEAMTTEREGDR